MLMDIDQAQLISQHGLRPGFIEIVPRPTPLPTDMLGWLQTFVRSSWFASFDDQVADKFMKEVADMCRPDAYWSIETPGMGDEPAEKDSATRRVSSPSEGWWIMYVRLRGVAYNQGDGSDMDPLSENILHANS